MIIVLCSGWVDILIVSVHFGQVAVPQDSAIAEDLECRKILVNVFTRSDDNFVKYMDPDTEDEQSIGIIKQSHSWGFVSLHQIVCAVCFSCASVKSLE